MEFTLTELRETYLAQVGDPILSDFISFSKYFPERCFRIEKKYGGFPVHKIDLIHKGRVIKRVYNVAAN